MMTSTKAWVAGVMVTVVLSAGTVRAGEKEIPKEKSVVAAVALGLDLIPGDSLLYAGRPIQAAVNFGLGTAGALLGLGGLMSFAEHEDEAGSMNDAAFALAGAVLFGVSFLWDLVGGIQGVQEHNARIRQQESFLNHVRPTLAVLPNGGFAGVQFAF